MIRRRDGFSGTVGLVPTMGYLHEGHLSMVRAARSEHPNVIATIFVNPTQFGPNEDFKSYPRDTERDLNLLEKESVDIVFMPSPEEMYPPDFNTWVDVGGITERLEGAVRPGHFRGVATVCAKLFNITRPNLAYFGQKDAQQVAVLKKMLRDLNMNLEISVMPIVREPDGLAMSSRNTYLSPEGRRAASVLSRSLALARRLSDAGETDAGRLRDEMAELIKKEPLARIDYISIADAVNLKELETVTPPALVSLAVRIETTRLIDNTVL